MLKSLLNYIDDVLKVALTWLIVSSKDPNQVSLAVKMFLLGLIPYTMQGIGLACTFGDFCVTIYQNDLESLASAISMVVFYGLSLWAALGFVWGTVRKIARTIAGKNKALEVD